MTCSHKNLIVNGDFVRGIKPWTGTNIRRVRNPHRPSDASILMGEKSGRSRSVLSQRISGAFENNCAYYLTFRIINVSPDEQPALFYATVAYLDSSGRIIRSTPLLLTPPDLPVKKYKPYFTIVPPPPRNTRQMKVVFYLKRGQLYIDTVKLASHTV